jgi:hypothetical protein
LGLAQRTFCGKRVVECQVAQRTQKVEPRLGWIQKQAAPTLGDSSLVVLTGAGDACEQKVGIHFQGREFESSLCAHGGFAKSALGQKSPSFAQQ